MRRDVIVLRSLDRSAFPARRRPWDRLAYGVVVGFLAGAVLFGLGIIKAQEVDAAPRYTPSSRGPRASYQTDQVQQWRELVSEYDWNVETALLVISCESQGDPSAQNPSSGAAGLFQAMPSWRGLTWRLFGSGNLLDPTVNTALAFLLWQDSGGRFSWHWQASVGCWGW